MPRSGVLHSHVIEHPHPVRITHWWRTDNFLVPLAVFIAIRLLTIVSVQVAVAVSPVQNPFATHHIFADSLNYIHSTGLIRDIIEPWHRWDTGWYVRIAGAGYAPDDGSITFMPMYPGLVAVVGSLVGDMLLGSLIVSNTACLIVLILLYHLIRVELKSRIRARYTLFALASFPTAFFLLAGYTESTFLAFAIGAWLAARRQRWWLTAVLVACAALTLMQACVFALPIAWMVFREFSLSGSTRRERWTQIAGRLAAVASGPVMVVLYNLVIGWGGLGNITDAYARVFGWRFTSPWAGINGMITHILAGQASGFDLGQLAALIFVIVLSFATLRLLPFVYQLYLWPTLIFILMPYTSRHFLIGMMRYALYFFPIFPVIGTLMVKYPRLRPVIISSGVLLQCILLVSFVHWVWIA